MSQRPQIIKQLLFTDLLHPCICAALANGCYVTGVGTELLNHKTWVPLLAPTLTLPKILVKPLKSSVLRACLYHSSRYPGMGRVVLSLQCPCLTHLSLLVPSRCISSPLRLATFSRLISSCCPQLLETKCLRTNARDKPRDALHAWSAPVEVCVCVQGVLLRPSSTGYPAPPACKPSASSDVERISHHYEAF